ncbi:MAG: helix-turn-helix domain-containing protein [Opitutales bacterium]
MTSCHLRFEAQRPLSEAYPTELTAVGDHIRKRRLDLGLLQRDVAGRIGVTALTIKNWELGHTEPEICYGPSIIDFLGYVPMHKPETVRDQLLAYRMIHGVSQRKAARRIGVDPTTWYFWENRVSEPTLERPKMKFDTHVLSILRKSAFHDE